MTQQSIQNYDRKVKAMFGTKTQAEKDQAKVEKAQAMAKIRIELGMV